MGVLVREIAALYPALAGGAPSPLPELPVQYGDFAVWQRRWLSGGELARQVAWWKARLAGLPAVLELPTDRPRPAMQSFRGERLPIALSADLSGAVRDFARRLGATPFMVFLAAFSAVLARWANKDDLLIGSPIANRNRAETEGLIGFFANTIALRADLAGDPGERLPAVVSDREHVDAALERDGTDLLEPPTDLHPQIIRAGRDLVDQEQPAGCAVDGGNHGPRSNWFESVVRLLIDK